MSMAIGSAPSVQMALFSISSSSHGLFNESLCVEKIVRLTAVIHVAASVAASVHIYRHDMSKINT